MNGIGNQASFWAGSTPVFADRSRLDGVLDYLKSQCGVVLTDNHVPLYQAPFLDLFPADRWQRYVVPAGESSKNAGLLADLSDFCKANGLDASSWILGIGGGLVCDLASWAAALAPRGVRLGLFPTSLAAMADAAIGDHVGTHLPTGTESVDIPVAAFVFLYPDFLATLPEIEIGNGLAEIAKIALALDAEFWNFLTTHEAALAAGDWPILAECVVKGAELKAKLVSEADALSRLDLGQPFARALEGLSSQALSYGEAVALGLVLALGLSEDFAGLPKGTAEEVARFLRALHFPLAWPPPLPCPAPADFAAALQSDNPEIHLRPVLCDRIGHARPAEPLPAWNPAEWLNEWLENHGRDYGFRQ